MGTNFFHVDTNPKILDWAITSSGWTTSLLSKRLGVNEKIISDWTKGSAKPTINQLENFATVVKRPLAIFFLEEVPEDKPLPKDYRRHPKERGNFDRKTLLAIRQSRSLQSASSELSNNIGQTLEPKLPKANLNSNTKGIADQYREMLNFNIGVNKKMDSPYKMFNYLRDVLEEKNVFVFQVSMPLEDARGFCLLDDLPYVIVINSKDSIKARLFTLAHEIGHVSLGKSEIGIPQEYLKNDSSDLDSVEVWCNDFASEFLLTEEEAKNIFGENKQRLLDTRTLNTLSNKYKFSKAMLLYNMHKWKFIDTKQYNNVLNRYTAELTPTTPKKKGKKCEFVLCTKIC